MLYARGDRKDWRILKSYLFLRNLSFLTSITDVLICNMPIAHTWLQTDLNTFDKTTLEMTTQAVMTTPRPELTLYFTILTSITHGLTCNIPILDDKLNWTPMVPVTTDHPSFDQPRGHDHSQSPNLTPDLTFLTLNSYVLTCNTLIWKTDLNTYDHPSYNHSSGRMTTPRPNLTPDLIFLTSVTPS